MVPVRKHADPVGLFGDVTEPVRTGPDVTEPAGIRPDVTPGSADVLSRGSNADVAGAEATGNVLAVPGSCPGTLPKVSNVISKIAARHFTYEVGSGFTGSKALGGTPDAVTPDSTGIKALSLGDEATMGTKSLLDGLGSTGISPSDGESVGLAMGRRADGAAVGTNVGPSSMGRNAVGDGAGGIIGRNAESTGAKVLVASGVGSAAAGSSPKLWLKEPERYNELSCWRDSSGDPTKLRSCCTLPVGVIGPFFILYGVRYRVDRRILASVRGQGLDGNFCESDQDDCEGE